MPSGAKRPETRVYLDRRVKREVLALTSIYGNLSNIVGAAVLAFIRSTDQQQDQMVRNLAKLRINPSAPAIPKPWTPPELPKKP